ncbi:MAG: triphosphoribosyl-dephospho-CoA synthase [Nitrososphaerales archaeon]
MQAERSEKTANDIMRAAQLAAALEVSATPKPGNVHRNADNPPTRFEHFLAGAVALGPAVREAAVQGVRASSEEIKYSEIGVGRCLKRAVLDIKSWHSGGNTHLGVCMLFMPLAAAAGALLTHGFKIEADELRSEVVRIIEATTSKDAVEFYRAVSSLDAGWLGRIEAHDIPDLSSGEALAEISRRDIALYELMRRSAEWDGVASELSNGLRISFTIGYPAFIETYRETSDINTATVNTFLKILSEVPDTFIARKVGLGKTSSIVEAVKIGMAESIKVSEKAKEILTVHRGMLTEDGQREVKRLDRELRSRGGTLNPGTTADITATSLMIALLTGFRP